jgi:hypothetical protein
VHRCLQVYTQQPPTGASQSELMRMAGVADAFELSSVSAACMAQLAALPADALEWGTVTAAFTLPAGVVEHDSSQRLLQRAGQQLQTSLGDLELTLQDQGKCQQLEQLPHAALLALLQDEQTRVAAEGTAVAAVALWVAAQEAAGGSVPLEQRQQLATAIRMVQLPSMYLATVLPSIGWLQGLLTPQHAVALFAAKSMPQADGPRFFRLCVLARDAADRDSWSTWLASARPRSAQHASVSVAVPASELNECGRAGAGGVWSSGFVCFGGYEFGVRLALKKDRAFRVSMQLRATGTAGTTGTTPSTPGPGSKHGSSAGRQH